MEPAITTPTRDPDADWPRIRGVAWSPAGTRVIASRDDVAACLADPDALLWVDVTAPSHVQVNDVADLLSLHPLIAEDIAERNQRAKVEEIEGAIHIVIFAIAYEGEITEVEIDMVLNHRSLLTVHEPGWDPFTLTQLRGDPASLLRRGPDFLLYALTDGIVDDYFPVLDAIEDEIDALQDDVIAKPTKWTLERLFALKRQLIGLRRAMSPAREIFNQLTNRDLESRQAGARHLLPRRLRPPDPRHGRAGQRPRARRRYARGLPLDDQQQPLDDHEAPHRRHRDPRGHRGGGRALRHERGRSGVRRR